MDYTAIVGSRCHGINIDSSDFDIVTSAMQKLVFDYPKYHIISHPKEKIIKAIIGLEKEAYFTQVLFPYQFIESNTLTEYIRSNREQIIKNNLASIYENHMRKARDFSVGIDRYYRIYPKRVAYACLYLDMLYKYATKDISFEEAYKPTRNWRDWLINLRYRSIEKDEILLTHSTLYEKATVCESFYKSRSIDGINSTIDDLNDILETKVHHCTFEIQYL